MDDPLLQYLFEISQEPRDELTELFASLARMEALEVEKKPLDAVLKDLDFGTAVVDPEGLSVAFSDVDAYCVARDKLFDPVVLTNLAKAGFVPVYCNDKAPTDEVPKFVIFFIPIGEAPGPDAKQLEPDDAAKQVIGVTSQFQGDKTEVDKEFPRSNEKKPAHESHEDLSDWISDWCVENGSAIDVWGNEELWVKIKQAVDSGAKVVASDSHEKTDRMVSHGWTLVADEENYDSYDSVLIKA